MPQATDEDRDEYSKRFGDIGCEHAIEELKRRGFVLTKEWQWIVPPNHKPTPEEFFWMGFLVDEWDFGWIVPAPAAPLAREEER